MAPRIGIDARLLAYREGGIAEYMRRLLQWLPQVSPDDEYIALHHAKHRHGQPAQPDDAPQLFGATVHTATVGTGTVRSATVFTPPHHRLEGWSLAVEVARLRLDVLHSPDFIPPRFGARQFVITIHDLAFLLYPQFQTPASRAYYAGQIRGAVRRAAHILAISEATKRDICRMLDVPPEHVTAQPLGVHEAFRPLRGDVLNALAQKYGLEPGYILFVGTFEPRKNIPTLIEAYDILRSRYADTPRLVLAGRRGWLYAPIFERIADSPYSADILCLEDPPFEAMPGLYNLAGVLALPSYYEGFGFTALEAMACGTPTVVSDRASLPEVVGDTGLLIDPEQPDMLAEALYRALSDTTFRATSHDAGLARAKQFTWAHTAQIAHNVYQDVLAR